MKTAAHSFGLWSKLDRQVVALVSRVLCVVSWSFAAGLNDVDLPSFPGARRGNLSVSERLGGWVVECAIVGPWVFLLEIAHSSWSDVDLYTMRAMCWSSSLFRSLFMVRTVHSASPFDWGYRGELVTCTNPWFIAYWRNVDALNLWTIVRDDIGYRAYRRMRRSPSGRRQRSPKTGFQNVSSRSIESSNRLRWGRLCHVVQTSPSQVSPKDETGMKKQSIVPLAHFETICSIIVDRPGHHTDVRALVRHLVTPWWPWWMQSRMSSLITRGMEMRSSYRRMPSTIARWLWLPQYWPSSGWCGLYAGHFWRQYSRISMHSASTFWLFLISYRRLLVAGRMFTAWLANTSISATNSSSSDAGDSTGARESASAVVCCLPGTYWTSGANLMSRSQKLWMRGGILQSSVEFSNGTRGPWSVSSVSFDPSTYSESFSHAHMVPRASFSFTA